ncbi:MAG: serine/threonine protein kinase [Bryobacterales bacterium]|nr:serine/threonine protein kinase [Bryobacterales bacterium]
MSPNQWERIQSLYHRLSELPAGQQAEALESECADDALVLEEVRELLRASPTGQLDDIVQQVAYDAASHGHERVGPYRLVQEIGRGGMGTVYLGTRDDKQFDRKVAIKFLNLGLDRPEYVRRFRQERQILADLEHPHIARLIEGGESSKGQPYLVMEYVEGKPLFAYCRERQLGRKQALELVAKICDAVQYAHSNLIVHRDLKPSNILVTVDGTPKLLDFGIAKVLADEGGETQPLTQATGQLLTIDYASPEQIRGEPISTVSDVYSLGVILYELLAGARPFQTADLGPLAYRILHDDPPKPSVRARKAGLPTVPAELDNVVLKAMAREPERRYRSANALADDLRRHLNGQPVLAHGESAWYVASKFMRRHRVETALAAFLALAVVALAIQLAIANDRLEMERDAAIRERSNARQVSDFMVELFGNAEREPNAGREITAREMLDMGARSLRAQQVTDPELRANLQMGVGAAYQRLGRWQDARLHLEEAMQLLRAVGESGVRSALRRLRNTQTCWRTGELAVAEATARELVEVAQQHRPKRLSIALSTLGNALSHQMKHAEAERAYRDGLAIEPLDGRNYIPLMANLSIALFRQGKFDESFEMTRQVKELMQTRWKQVPKAMAFPYDTIGNLESLRGNYAASIQAFQEVARILRGPDGEEDPNLAHCYCGMAETYLRMRDTEAAAEPLAACASIRATTVQPDSFDAMTVLQLQGLYAMSHGDPISAETRFRRVLEVHEATYGKDHVTRVKSLRLLGMAEMQAGNLAAAEQHFAEAFAVWGRLGLSEDPELAELALEAGKAAREAGRLTEAEELLRRSVRVREHLRMSPGLLAATRLSLAECLLLQGKLEEAGTLVDAISQQYREYPPEIRGQRDEAEALGSRLTEARKRRG